MTLIVNIIKVRPHGMDSYHLSETDIKLSEAAMPTKSMTSILTSRITLTNTIGAGPSTVVTI
jgi:hypothetical protein